MTTASHAPLTNGGTKPPPPPPNDAPTEGLTGLEGQLFFVNQFIGFYPAARYGARAMRNGQQQGGGSDRPPPPPPPPNDQLEEGLKPTEGLIYPVAIARPGR